MIAKATSGSANTNKRIVVAASCAGIFLAVLRSTSADTALPDVRGDLGGALSGLQWVGGATRW
jgi:hypothetical protein